MANGVVENMPPQIAAPRGGTIDEMIASRTAGAGAQAASQATTIEQTRAVAEVHAAIMVAQRCPRDVAKAIKQMREACRLYALAERAFFRFPRGGQSVSGSSIHLARELARCWGNVDYGIKELNRDDARGVSEMLAFAWDLETNTRSETTFLVPHRRDKRGGAEDLTDLRDIYENNANMGARRLRQTIFSVLPVWFTEDAEETCRYTLEKGGDRPRDQRVADCIRLFSELGIAQKRLEKKIGTPSSEWTDVDIANLGIVYKSIKRGEIAREDEFPLEDAPALTVVAPPVVEPEQKHEPVAEKKTETKQPKKSALFGDE